MHSWDRPNMPKMWPVVNKLNTIDASVWTVTVHTLASMVLSSEVDKRRDCLAREVMHKHLDFLALKQQISICSMGWC